MHGCGRQVTLCCRPIGQIASGVRLGFLGAGKSTLVRHILTAQHGRRIAVIVNEFGEKLGIERAIVNENDVSWHCLQLVYECQHPVQCR